MDVKGQATILGLMLFTMVLIFALMIVPFLRNQLEDTATQMGCQYENLTTGESMTCLAMDLFLPFFIGSIVLAGAGVIGYKYGLIG